MPEELSASLDGVSVSSIDEELGVGDDQASALRRLVGAASSERVVERAPEAPVGARRAKVVTIASGKGGVGKTCLAVNMGYALARMGVNVTLLDADLGTANADLLCGVTPVARLHHAIRPISAFDGGNRTLDEIAIELMPGYRLIAGISGVRRGSGERAMLLEAIGGLEQQDGLVLIDAGAGVGDEVLALVEASDYSVVVATAEPTSLTDAYALMKSGVLGGSMRGDRVGVVVNGVLDGAEARSTYARIRATSGRFLGMEPPLLGWIAQDLRVAEAVRVGRPLMLRHPNAPVARQIVDIGERVVQGIGLSTVSPGVDGGGGSLVRALRRLFR